MGVFLRRLRRPELLPESGQLLQAEGQQNGCSLLSDDSHMTSVGFSRMNAAGLEPRVCRVALDNVLSPAYGRLAVFVNCDKVVPCSI